MEKYEGLSSISEERQERGEVLRRLMVLEKGIDGFGGKTTKEVFDPENEIGRRGLLSALSCKQYFQLISGVNGILRAKIKKDWVMDGVGVTAAGTEVIGNHIFPRHSDKKEILTKSWNAAQEMNAEGRSLEDIGMLLGSMLVETHPFGDGNGRTSRLIYLMVKEGFSEEKMKTILGEDGRDEFDMALTKADIDTFFEIQYGRGNGDLNPQEIADIKVDDQATPFGRLQFPKGISEDVRENIVQALRNDIRIFVSGILRFFQRHSEIPVSEFTKVFGERNIILFEKLISTLPNDQIEELEDMYWEMKKKYTESMIDIFVHPDKPEYQSQYGEAGDRILDVFKKRIANHIMVI